MNCEANNGQQTCQYILAAVARAKEIERAKFPRQLSPEEMNWYANYNEGKDASKSGGKKHSSRKFAGSFRDKEPVMLFIVLTTWIMREENGLDNGF